MSNVGQTPRAQRVANRSRSRALSEESTGASSAQRARGGRNSRQPTPVPRDGDDNMPPVPNKTSKAYGAPGKMAAKAQNDSFKGYRDPAAAIEKIHGKDSDVTSLSPVPEESESSRSRPRVRRAIPDPNSVRTQSMLDAQFESVDEAAYERDIQAGGAGQSPVRDEKANEGTVTPARLLGNAEALGYADPTPDRSSLVETFWGPRGGFPLEHHWSNPNHPWFDEMPWYWQLCGYIMYFANPLNLIRLVCFSFPTYIFESIMHALTFLYYNVNFIALSKKIAIVLGFCFVADLLVGPILPVNYDLPGMRALRPHTGLWNTPPSCPNVDELKLRISRYQLGNLDGRITDLEKKCFSLLDNNAKSAPKPRINYFEPGQGARVNPYLTSPSLSHQSISWSRYIIALVTLQPYRPMPVAGSPIQALTEWTDGGLDRWCAPVSRGKLQITVHTAKEIAPSELVIEHIAKDASIRIGMAPREVELWAEVIDDDAFLELHGAISSAHPELFDMSSPQMDRELDASLSLPNNFLLVGRFLYDIHSNEAVQSFALPFDLAFLNIKAQKFSVRVNSNWGDLGATCLNRLRLHGKDMSGEVEWLVDPL